MPWLLARCHSTGARAASKPTSPAQLVVGTISLPWAIPAQPSSHPTELCQGPWAELSLQSHMSRVWALALLAHSCCQPQTKVVSCLEQQDVCGSQGEHGTALPAQQPPPAAHRAAGHGVRVCWGPPGLLLHPGQRGSSPVLVVDVVPKARRVDDCQLHANALLLNL